VCRRLCAVSSSSCFSRYRTSLVLLFRY